jgi:AraC-like ligand binding domain
MDAAVRRGDATTADALAAFRAEGCSPARPWRNAAGDRYGRHEHGYHKVLYCVAGSIVFHLDDGDVELTVGDRLDLEPGTPHAATVGPDGCECVEASRSPDQAS